MRLRSRLGDIRLAICLRDTVGKIWIRSEPDQGWMEPVIAGPGANIGWESKEEAELIAESFRDRASTGAEVRVFPEGQHPGDGI